MSDTHTTHAGRVVYRRKLHILSAADLARMQKKFILDEDPFANLANIIDKLNTDLLKAILEKFGSAKYAETVKTLLYELVGHLLQGLGLQGFKKDAAAIMKELAVRWTEIAQVYEDTGVFNA